MIKVLIAAIIYMITPVYFLWLRKKNGNQQRLFKGILWIAVLLIVTGICIVYHHLNTLICLNTFTNEAIPWDKVVFDALVWAYAGYCLLLYNIINTFPKK